ncbi:ATP-binding cassette domain-containing protein [Desulfovibrio aminophilus]|uniref:ATP-binding cassette domain-containing protein n=1 Tax=Desulfovibrio aminophilus TaxID=81425 RepID=UPI003390F890
MAGTLISVEDVNVSLGGRRVLDTIRFRLMRGEHTAVQGRNGSGKSTLMRLLRGEIFPDDGGGRIFWHTPEGPDASPMSGRGMVALASPAMLELYVRQGWNLSGEELILSGRSEGPLLYSEPEPGEREEARELARTVGVEHLLAQGVATLSQGQLCLLFLARACITRPPVLLLDEFSNGLDARSRARMLELLEVVGRTSTLVIATHRNDSLPLCLHRAIRLDKGRILSDGPCLRPAAKRALAPSIPEIRICPQPLADAEPLVRIRNATVYVDRVPVLREIDWSLHHGEQWILSGPNGAGKSTLLRLIAGEEYPAAGGAITRILPRHGGEVADRETLGRAISLVSDRQQAAYGYDLSGEELVLSGFDNSVGVYREYSRAERATATGWLERLGAASLAERSLRSLSTGQLRILFLARAMVRNPEILLLDEPFSGLDSTARAGMMALLENLIATGVHLVLVTHHADDVPRLMTHVACMEQGRIVAAGPRTAR